MYFCYVSMLLWNMVITRVRRWSFAELLAHRGPALMMAARVYHGLNPSTVGAVHIRFLHFLLAH